MSDQFTKAERSQIMRAVKSKNTVPEILVRKIVHRLGYRFRLHRCDLPGTPDIVLPGLRKIINIHGCFWHLHTCRHGQTAPRNNAKYWQQKRLRNAARDRATLRQLRHQRWRVLTLWQCQLKNPSSVARRIKNFLES